MRKTWLGQCVVVVACCVGITGCTISQWVTDSRTEVIPEASATSIRPILEIDQLSQERPELLVKLSKQLEGPLEVQEHKHEQIKTIWGNSLLNVGIASLAFPVSPIYLVMRTMAGEPGDGVSGVVNSFLAATGFNAMEGSMFHISEQRGESKIDRTPMGNGTRTVPWPFGVVEVKADDQAPSRLKANQNGNVAIDFKQLPIQLSHRSNDLALSISAQGGTVTAAESVTVPVSTMVAWEQKEAARAKLEEENKAQWERDRPAREARERAAQARAAEEKRIASIKAAAEARAYEQERARKEAQDARETSEAIGTLLGAFAQMEQNKADRAQAQYDNQQRVLQAQQEQQRQVQEQQNKAYMAEAARAEAFNREAALSAKQREADNLRAFQAQQERDVAERNRHAREVQDQYERTAKQAQAEVDAKRKQTDRENAARYEEQNKKQVEQAEAKRQRDAEAQRQQQELTNRRLAQEASIARETSSRIAEIQAEVNRRDAVTVIPYEQGSCPPSTVIINNTKVHLWVTFEYTMMIVGEGSFPASIAWPVAPHQRTSTFTYGAPSCDSGKQWSIPAGGVTKWQHTGRPDVP